MLKAINLEEVDHVPCALMSFTALRKRCGEDMYELVRAERSMGLDSMLFIPYTARKNRPESPDLRGLPVRFHPEVRIREWSSILESGECLVHKEYQTPAGPLTTSVKISGDWPHGEHVPFLDDYQIPRSIKPLITKPEDLKALQFLLMPPTQEDIEAFRKEVEKAKAFVQQEHVLLAGGWGIGADMVGWLFGLENLAFAQYDQPDFMNDLLEMIHVWNMKRMKVILDGHIDLYIRRAWYEGCDFITPKFYRKAVLPRLAAEVDLAHEYGVKFGYIRTGGTKPLLDDYAHANVDVLLGIDPIQGSYTDLPLTKSKLGETTCLWGGISSAITIETGTEVEVRSAVREAIKTLGPKNFILSPVDNVTEDAPLTWDNLEIMIDEWKKTW